MKTILAFGDSLTWGSCPHTNNRHPKEDRWPEAMAAGLDGVDVISEGLRGRTTAYYRAGNCELRGDLLLPALIQTHDPLDLVMIMLGTNDVYAGISEVEIYWGLRRLVDIVQSYPYSLEGAVPPKILLISPPTFVADKCFGVSEEKVALGRALHSTVRRLAEEKDVAFFNAASVAHAEAGDGLHLEAHVSRALGEALCAPVKALLNL